MRTPAVLAIALLAVVGTACGGADPGATDDAVASLETTSPSGSDGTTTPEADEAETRRDALVDFARCMREHGIDMPDPQTSSDGGGIAITLDEDVEPEEMEAAQQACRPIMDEAFGEMEPPSPEEMEAAQERMLEHARCMREHGVDMPDPVIDAAGRITVEGPLLEGDDAATREKLEEAAEACSDGDGPGFVFESGPEDGDGPSFGFAITPDGSSAP